MSPRRARRGSRDSSISIRRSSFFSMRRRFRRTWRAAWLGSARRALPNVRAVRMEDEHARGRAAVGSRRRADDDRRRAGWGGVLAYVEQVLAPTLSAGEMVLMDGVATHKVAGVKEAIEAKGAHVVYLPRIRPTSIRSRNRSP